MRERFRFIESFITGKNKKYPPESPITPDNVEVIIDGQAEADRYLAHHVGSTIAMMMVVEKLAQGGEISIPSLGMILTSEDLINPVIEADHQLIEDQIIDVEP